MNIEEGASSLRRLPQVRRQFKREIPKALCRAVTHSIRRLFYAKPGGSSRPILRANASGVEQTCIE